MKTFEEKYTAWIDGTLSAEDAARFERELDSDALAGKTDPSRLGQLLRSHAGAPPLENPDFFTHQIMHRIEAAERPEQKPALPFFSIRRLLWAGATALLMAAGLSIVFIPAPAPTPDPYFAEIVDVRTGDPSISATPIYNAKDNVTVLWLDGLDYLPASYQLQ